MDRIDAFSQYKHNKSMPPAIPLDEIKQFELDNNITLPLELKLYLSCVSRSIFKSDSCWQEIKLDVNRIKIMPDIIDGIACKNDQIYDQIKKDLGADIYVIRDNKTYDEYSRYYHNYWFPNSPYIPTTQKVVEMSGDDYNKMRHAVKKTWVVKSLDRVTQILHIRYTNNAFTDNIILDTSNNQYIGEIWQYDPFYSCDFEKFSGSFFEYLLMDKTL